MPAAQRDLQTAKNAAIGTLLRPAGNVVGVGIGKRAGQDYLRIYVVNDKLPPDISEPQKPVPQNFNGVPTKVIKIGRLGRRGKQPKLRVETTPQPGSPIRVQTDAPNVNSGAIGTLGMLVAAADSSGTEQGRYILGCNHILAANGRVGEDPTSKIVWARFVGEQDVIADPGVYVLLTRNGANPVDCALARIKDHINLSAIFPEDIGWLTSPDPSPAQLDLRVKKVGAATGLTYGSIVDLNADLYVYNDFGTFRFTNQVIIDAGDDGHGNDNVFATEGDSGSVVLNDTNQAVAMIFAGSGRFAVACALTTVLKLLQDEMRGDEEEKLGKPKHGPVTLHLVTKPVTA